MKIKQIDSSSNELLKQVRSLHKRSMREKQKLFLIEGWRWVVEAVEKGVVVREIIASKTEHEAAADAVARLGFAELTVVGDSLFNDLVSTTSSCGVVAMAEIPAPKTQDIFSGTAPLVVVADSIQDPGNLGTLMRTAYAAQANCMILSKGCADAYNPKVVRSAAGALFDLAILADIDAEEIIAMLEERRIAVVRCDAGASKHYFAYDLKKAVALVFGNEGQGLTEPFKECRGDSISIPMNPKAESLNVSVSAGIILFEAFRQRSSGGLLQ